MANTNRDVINQSMGLSQDPNFDDIQSAMGGSQPGTGGGTVPETPSVFSMTQLTDANRVYQRSSSTGGAGTGTGTIPVPINVTTPGPIYARARSASDDSIVQAPFALPNTTATGAQTKNVTGMNARLGWFYVDLAPSASGPWQMGTTRVGMGGLTLLSGQSLATRSVQISDTPYVSVASLTGAPIPVNGALFHCAINNSTDEYSRPVWDVMQDTQTARYNSPTAAEYLRLKIAQEGVQWAMIGFSRGGTSATNWVPGGRDNPGLRANVTDAGGFEEFVWYQGQGEGATPLATIKDRLTAIFGDMTTRNTIKGASYRKIVGGVANNVEGSFTQPNMLTVRRAQTEWAAENGAFYINCADLDLVDTVHQSQKGAVTLGRHFYRAGTPESDAGPIITGGTRAAGSSAIKLSVSLPSGATALVPKGSPANRFSVFPAGSLSGKLAFAGTSPLTISGTEITLNLASAPANDTALDVYAFLTLDTKTGDVDVIYDNNLDSDGLTVGRQLMASVVPVAIAAPGGVVTPDPTYQAGNLAGTGMAYAAGATGFGQARTGGYAVSTAASRSADIIPPTDTWTVEMFFTPGGNSNVAFQAPGKTYIGVSSGGLLVVQYSNTGGTDTFVNGTQFSGGGSMPAVVNTGRRHISVVADPTGVSVYLDGALVGAKSTVAPKAAAPESPPVVGAFNTDGVFTFVGAIDEFVIWPTAKYTASFTPPTAPYAGTEGMRALYHLDGNTNAAATV